MHTNMKILDPIDAELRHREPIDPADWDSLRDLGHRMVDEMFEHLRKIDQEPVWRPIPDEVERRLSSPLPLEGIGAEAAYEEFLRDVVPYPVGNTHPRFFGWVIGGGSPLGALAEFLAASVNPNVSGIQGAPALVELQVIEWLKELLGFPTDASGILVSGGSMANILGLAVALDDRAGFDVARQGLAAAPRPPVVYTSTETHFSIEKAVRLLGLGSRSLRKIRVDSEFRIDQDALVQAVEADRASGLKPFCIVGNAGTVNTGAFDDLDGLANIAERHGLWLHVDGAFGTFAVLDPASAPLAKGIERADSLGFDLHKWMAIPIEAGAVLIRDVEAHERAFTVQASYVSPMPGGLAQDSTRFADRGPQLTRGFRAAKIWLSLKANGVEPYRELVARNIRQARYLADRVVGTPELELLAPVPLNVVCFRYRVPGMSLDELDQLNRDLLVRLQEEGTAAPTHTTLHGQFAIRACMVNHRTRRRDLDMMVNAILRLGRLAAAEVAA